MEDYIKNNKELLYRLAYFRNKKNMSAYELSMKLGKYSSYINRVENDRVKISTETLFEIFEVLDITAFEFFCPSVYQNVQDIELLKSLNEKEVSHVLELLRIRRD